MKKHAVKIVKVPGERSPQYRQEFVNQPINYLKIIENKEKVKYEHLNKDYEPGIDDKALVGKRLDFPNPDLSRMPEPSPQSTSSSPKPSPPPSHSHQPPSQPQQSHQPSTIQQQQQQSLTPSRHQSTLTPPMSPANFEAMFDIPYDSDDEDHPATRTRSDNNSNITESFGHSTGIHYPPQQPPPSQSGHTPLLTPPQPPSHSHSHVAIPIPVSAPPSAPTSVTRQQTPPSSPPQPSSPNIAYPPHQSQSQSQPQPAKNQHERLRDFLNGSESDNSDDEAPSKYRYNVSTPQKQFTRMNKGPPTLQELEKRGEYQTRTEYMDVHQIDQMVASSSSPAASPRPLDTREQPTDYQESSSSQQRQPSSRSPYRSSSSPSKDYKYSEKSEKVDDEEDEESIDDKKRDILVALDMLRKKYPDYADTVPDLNMQTSYKEMAHIYKLHLRRIEIDHNVGDYRTYMICGFLFTEHVLSKLIRINLDGFTSQQMMSMKQYDRFLIEIGEKDYLPKEKRWPVELRLVIVILINAAIFIISKAILNKTGANLLNMFNSVVSRTQGGGNSQQPKRRMKMPDLSDIADDWTK